MKIKKLKKGFEKLTKGKARIIAHLIGDGAHYKTYHDYVLKYEVKDKESINQFKKDVIDVYGLEPSCHWNISGKTGKAIEFVRLRSKLAFEDLLNYSTYFSKDWKLKKIILDSSLKIKREFLKALFDDEGSVICYKKPIIRLYSINKKGLKQIEDIIWEFGISCKLVNGFGLKRNVSALVIKDIKKYHKKIGFNLKRKQKKLEYCIKKGKSIN